jgi:hypothetical protein
MDGIAFSAAACTACPYFHNTCFLQRSLQTDKIRQANDLAIPQPAVDTRIELLPLCQIYLLLRNYTDTSMIP